jgi:hypothetical protein
VRGFCVSTRALRNRQHSGYRCRLSIRIAVQKLFIRDDEGLDRDSFDAGSNILGGVSAAAGWPTTNVSSTKTAVGKRFIPFDIGAGFMVPPN